jgi:deoxycytidylate deaminase
MKALNNAGVKEIIYKDIYLRTQTGGEKMEEEDEAMELARAKGIKIRKYDGEVYCNFERTEINAK